MDPEIITKTDVIITEGETRRKPNPLFPFMGIGSLIYAFFYTLFLYRNNSGLTYPFFVGGTCLFFFFYLKKCGLTAKKFTVFITVSLILLGISTCLTDSWILIFFNKTVIFCLFFYLMLHNLYEDRSWDLAKYTGAILTVVFSSFLHLLRPFTDFAAFRNAGKERETERNNNTRYIFLGILIALPLLSVILALLASADAVFRKMLVSLSLFRPDLEDHIWGIGFLFLFAFFASYSIMSRISDHNLKEETARRQTAEPVTGITFTGLISVVYLIFCLIQLVYLFGGFGTLPTDYTYARYAREGFFQLVFVCMINLSLILVCTKRFRRSRILQGLLSFICLCTYIMIASSAYRMLLYIQMYYLTFLRIFVLWALLVIFFLITGALFTIHRQDFPLVKYCLTAVTVLYLGFSFSHPDYWIARYNLNHSTAGQEGIQERPFKDYNYLMQLSLDAAPVIFQKADELGYGGSESQYWFSSYASRIVLVSCRDNDFVRTSEEKLPNRTSIRSFNLSRWTAYHAYTDYYRKYKGFAD